MVKKALITLSENDVAPRFDLATEVLIAALGADGGRAARTVTSAMMTHPDFVAGQWRLDTELMQAYPGQLLVKVGAEGIFCAALPHEGLGLALKVEDGSSRAAIRS